MLLFLSISVEQQHIVGCACLGFRLFLSCFLEISKPVSLFICFCQYAMLAQGSRQYWSVWNAGLLTIAHFPASSKHTLVCFLLWRCLVICFLCLLGLACLMKLCSLETLKCTPVSIWYCFGWYMEFLFGLYPNEIVLIFCMSAVMQGPAALWGESAWKTAMSPLCNRGSAGKTGVRRPNGWGALLPGKCLGLFPPCLCGGKLEEHQNLWRGAMAVRWRVHAWPLACTLAGKAGLSGRDVFSPTCVRGLVVLCRHLLQAPTYTPQA